MGRKNLDELIHGDRSIARSYRQDWTPAKDFVGSSQYGNGDDLYSGASTEVGWSHGSGSTTTYHRCYLTHPPLKLPGTDLVIYGGSCVDPAVKDADVYIGFDGGMKFTKRGYPWNNGTEFLFRIPDMGTPTNQTEFGKLVDWTKTQLEAGKKVHCGCMGGHGRTGMFLAALVSRFGEKDAITYVRKNYCKKAVESTEQVKYLKAQFGIAAAEPTKGASYWSSKSTGKKGSKGGNVVTLPAASDSFTHVNGNGCIWR
jgi:hypothetical protein